MSEKWADGLAAPFVVVEGLDGAGTTTQAQLLVERLQSDDVDAHLTREPSDGPVGVLVRQMLEGRVVGRDGERVDGDALALLFAADRVDHAAEEIEPEREAGRLVVSDRYYHSSLAYQSDTNQSDTRRAATSQKDGARGDSADFAWVETLNERAPTPDLTVFLDVSAEVCVERLAERSRRERYEAAETIRELEPIYREVMDRLEARGEPIVRVDGERSIDDVHDDVYATVDSRLLVSGD